MSSEVEINLNATQSKMYLSSTTENLMVSGIGGGKSFWLGWESYNHCRVKYSLGFLGAPTFDTVKNSTLPQVVEAWDALGMKDGVHYVINTKPPTSWRVRPYSKLSNNKVITFRWGSYILVDSLENYNKHRGTQFDYILIDELRDMRSQAYTVMRGRLRGKAYKTRAREQYSKEIAVLDENIGEGLITDIEYLSEIARLTGYRMTCVTTPPENPEFLEELMERETVNVVRGTIEDNRINLPAGYIESLREAYDPVTAARELDAELIRNVENPFITTFDRKKHVTDKAIYHHGLPLYLAFDFNLDPFVCLIAQHGYIGNKPFIHIIDEIYMTKNQHDRSKTYVANICQKIKDRFPGDFFQVTGDVSGGQGQLSSRLDFNAYQEIINELDINEKQIFLPSTNPLITLSRTLNNSLYAKHPELLIHPRCKEYINDCELVQTDSQGKIKKDKDSRRSHLLDAGRYYFNMWHSDFIPSRKR